MENPFSNLFKKQPKSVLGVDIGSSAIKVVQLKNKGGKAVLETYGELSLGPYGGVEIGQATNLPPEKIVEALTDLMKEKEVNITTNFCGLAIPFSSSLMTLVEMPALPYKQMASMVPLEARKYVPVPISEVALDWTIIPRDEKEEESSLIKKETETVTKIKKTDVLIVAIHNDTISRFHSILEKTNLLASFFEVEIFSTIRAVLDQEKTPVMVLDMGAASTKLYIIERGVVRVSHTINTGSQDLTKTISNSLGIPISEAEILKRSVGARTDRGQNIKDVLKINLDRVFIEANQVVLNYQRKYNKTISKVMMIGGGSSLKGLTELAQADFQTEVVAGNPFLKTEAPAFLENILKETGPEFAVAVGVALRRLQESS